MIATSAAGLRAAIAVDQQQARVLVVGKRPRDDSHTVLASGGINAALATADPDHSWSHAADSLREGQFLADPRAVEFLSNVPGTMRVASCLVRCWRRSTVEGCRYSRTCVPS